MAQAPGSTGSWAWSAPLGQTWCTQPHGPNPEELFSSWSVAACEGSRLFLGPQNWLFSRAPEGLGFSIGGSGGVHWRGHDREGSQEKKRGSMRAFVIAMSSAAGPQGLATVRVFITKRSECRNLSKCKTCGLDVDTHSRRKLVNANGQLFAVKG